MVSKSSVFDHCVNLAIDNALQSDTNTEQDLDPLQTWISEQFSASKQPPRKVHQLDDQFKQFENFQFDKRAIGKLDVVGFWKDQAKNPGAPLYQLAVIALDIICVPVTEVTAERLFSHLNFVFNKHRSSLKSGIVEDILFCRWNSERLE
jgi:hypothetical protein